MKSTYHITARQLVLLALATSVFAASAVLLYDRFGSDLLGRWVGARTEKTLNASKSIESITDPSVATDEQNNREIYTAMSPGVVNITSTVYVQDWFNAYPKQGTGSGSILDREGHILTNFHVIQDAEKLEVSLSNNHNYQAKVIGFDPDNDLAVIKIDAPASELSTIPLGESKDVFVGQKVLAIGNPFGFDHTLTTGIVSGLSRPIRSEFTQRLIEGVIQTDAAINPGNSGGPLLNSKGQMIGINTMIFSPTGSSVGIGFAVPVETAKLVIDDILKYGRVRKPKLGISPIPLSARLSEVLQLPVKEGMLIAEVVPGGSADKAGIRGATQQVQIGRYLIPVGGDIIISADNQPIRSNDDLDRALKGKNIGDKIQVEIMRGSRKTTLTVQLAELPRSGM
ncbi:MAG: trypsin-like peptidase domain-containing protein [Acidobacteria bacterium]|nr:trypsin-like peptidase domain-containing protein [Acidobacteriota bacterium]MBK9705483.1 trypsin-like peptidase domain-containing protein [Acidobacteriota bacterium]